MEKELSSKEFRQTNYYLKLILQGSAMLCVFLGVVFAFLFYLHIPIQGKMALKKEQVKVDSLESSRSYFETNGNVGGFIGGVAGALFSLAGVFLLFLTLRNQNETGERDKIEGRFFEFVRLHRENINELLYRDGRSGQTIASGRKVFKEVYEQILEASEIANLIFKVFPPKDCLNANVIAKLQKQSIDEFATISLVYSIVFFGVAKKNDHSTFNSLTKDFKADFAQGVIRIFSLIPAQYEKDDRKLWDEIINKKILDNKYVKLIAGGVHSDLKEEQRLAIGSLVYGSHFEIIDLYLKSGIFFKRFGGHQHKLGHYFRHLFQAVKYIDNQQLLSYQEKYEYIKTLRAQLSNYEQYVLFYNSIAFVGREWEFNYLSSLQPDRLLISKYNMIKNIPDVKANGINISRFYHLVDFEFEAGSKDREAFAREFWID